MFVFNYVQRYQKHNYNKQFYEETVKKNGKRITKPKIPQLILNKTLKDKLFKLFLFLVYAETN